MKSKKGQALADKLIDDLLDDEDSGKTGSFKSKSDSQPFYLKEEASEEDRTMNLQDQKQENPPEIGAEDDIIESFATVVATKKQSKETVKEESQVSFNKSKSSRSYITKDFPQNSNEMSLVQSENLRVAQQKIIDVENEISRLRLENDELAAAADTLRKMVEDLKGQVERLQNKLSESVEAHKSEKEILINTASAKDKLAAEFKQKVQELETRLTTNIHKIRNRERELENRLELVKIESHALVRSKDELILELKRQIDQTKIEIENYRNKSQELKKRSDEKQEILRRTVKTLRLALTMLEGEEDGSDGKNKAS